MNTTIIIDANRLNAKNHEHKQAEISAENNGAMWHAIMDTVNDARYASDVNAEFARLVKDIDDALTARIRQSPDLTVEAAAAALKNDLKGRVITHGLDDDVRPYTLNSLINQAADEMIYTANEAREAVNKMRDKRLQPLRDELVGVRGHQPYLEFYGNVRLDGFNPSSDFRPFKPFLAHVTAYIASRSGIETGDTLANTAEKLKAEILESKDKGLWTQEDLNNIEWVVDWAVNDVNKIRKIFNGMIPDKQKNFLSRMNPAERLVKQAIKRADILIEKSNDLAVTRRNEIVGQSGDPSTISAAKVDCNNSIKVAYAYRPFTQLAVFDRYYYPSYDPELSKKVRGSEEYRSLINEAVVLARPVDGGGHKYGLSKQALEDWLWQRAEDLSEPDVQEDFKKAVTEYIESLPEYIGSCRERGWNSVWRSLR